ncbi:hypothetical protein HQ586_00690 [Candidatus Bathyarchaeota archaeon]|nr:hypothetical protein [Candidatus Bathyarchaeota archaeon]
MSGIVSEELIKSIMAGTYEHPKVEEKLYADIDTLSTDIVTVEEGTVPDGHEGIIVSIAVSSDKTAVVYIERDGKQFYENGLNCAGLSSILETAGADREGVDNEVFLGIRLKEKGKWKLGFKATTGIPDISWRLRVRHFKKG